MSANSTDASPHPYDDPSIPYVEPPENPLFKETLEMMKLGEIFRSLNINLSIISIASGFIVLSIIAAMWLYDRKLVNRVSLRLTAMISLVDVLTGIAIIEYSTYVARDTLRCTVIAWTMSFCPQLYLFLTVMIAFNLQIVFLHRKKVSSFSDRWYIPVALFAAIVINIPPLVYNRFGYDSGGQKCLYRDLGSRETQMWKLVTFLIPVLLSLAYCTSILVTVICKLIFEHRKLADVIHTGSKATLNAKAKRQKLLLLKLVSRIAMYAAIPLANITGIVVEYFWMVVNVNQNVPLWIVYWAIIGSCLPGLFNCIAFLFDPAIHNALRKVKKDLVDSYGYEKPSDSEFTVTLSSLPLSHDAYFQNSPARSSHSAHSPTTPTFPPPLTTLYPPSPTYSPPSPVSPNHSSFPPRIVANHEAEKKNNRILQWLVRTFLDTKKEPMRFSMLQPRFNAVERCTTTPNNSNSTLPRQNLGIENSNNNTLQDFNATLIDKRRTLMKREFNEREPLDQRRFSTSTTVTCYNPNAYSDTSTLTTVSECSSLDRPIRIHVHPPPGSVTGIIEIGSSRRHDHSDSRTSIASRDSVDNDVSVY